MIHWQLNPEHVVLMASEGGAERHEVWQRLEAAVPHLVLAREDAEHTIAWCRVSGTPLLTMAPNFNAHGKKAAAVRDAQLRTCLPVGGTVIDLAYQETDW